MKTETNLVGRLLPVRSRISSPQSGGSYFIRAQQHDDSGRGGRAPGDVLAFDDGGGGQIPDKNGKDDACWVARAVYGADNPRWLLFRSWLLGEAPAWFRALYLAKGPGFAEWLADKPLAKAVIRRWMDRRISCSQH